MRARVHAQDVDDAHFTDEEEDEDDEEEEAPGAPVSLPAASS